MTKEQILGYIDTNINIQGDTYYADIPPKIITTSGGTGKFVLKERSEYEKIHINRKKLSKFWYAFSIIILSLIFLLRLIIVLNKTKVIALMK